MCASRIAEFLLLVINKVFLTVLYYNAACRQCCRHRNTEKHNLLSKTKGSDLDVNF